MKFSKSLFIAFAGLGLFACSNEDVTNGAIEGTGMVEVTIKRPAGRSVNPSTSGNTVVVGGDIYVKVYNASGEQTGETFTIQRSNEQTLYTAKIYGVTNPAKVVAYCNEGEAVNSTATIAVQDSRLQAVPASIPAYGEATLEESDIQGEMKNDKDGKVYKKYAENIALQIPVARIEVDGLTHVNPTASKFQSLTIDGVYLDNIYATKDAKNVTDYLWDESSKEGQGAFPVLYDKITENNSFLQAGVSFPQGENQAFGYNFFVGTELPHLKVYFAKATGKTETISQPRYAIVKTYKNAEGTPLTQFEAGKIYKITNVTLEDKHIGPNEGGDTDLYGVEVTVTEATWSVLGIEGNWVEQ